MCSPLLRRLVALLLSAALVFAIACASASADLPPLVAKNMSAVTELEYKFFDVEHSDDEAYPTCHRVCQRLFRALDDPSSQNRLQNVDQLFLLAARTQLIGDFNNQSFDLPVDAPVDKNVRLGSAYWRNGPQRYSGLQVPSASADSSVHRTKLEYPHTELESFIWAGGTAVMKTQAVEWVGDKGLDNSCDSNSKAPSNSPGSDWQLLEVDIDYYYCTVWDPGTQQWDHLPGTAYLWAWWHAATFYAPSKLTPWIAPDDPETMDLAAPDPGFATALSRTDGALSDSGDDYVDFIEWVDHALGGTWSAPSPRELDGDANPGAPNLKHAFCGDPVNCATGNFTESYDDTTVQGPGVTLTQSRSYNSQEAAAADAPGPFGYGWAASFRATLSFPSDSDDVIVHQDNGSQVRFGKGYDGDYEGDEFVQATLAKLANGHFRYTLPNQLVYEFDASGHLLSETDSYGNQTTLAYDSNGHVATVTDAVGRQLTYAYNGDGTVDSVTDPAGQVVHYGYADGDLTSVTDVGGGVTHFAYDSDHQITTVTDPRGHVVTRNTYDDDHRVIAQRDALDHETTWDYGTDETTITDPSGSVTHEEFTDLLPTKITNAVGTPSQSTTRFVYDDADNVVQKIDGDGKQWDYDYDVRGNLVKTTDPLGHATTYGYDDAHHVIKVEKPGGLTTELHYEPNGELTSTSRYGAGLWATRTYSYDGHGEVTQVQDSAPNVSRSQSLTRDGHGNVTSTTSFAGRTSTATYDTNGFVLTATTARGKTTTTVRDAYEQPTTVTDPRGKVTTYDYDADENPTSVTDRNGHAETTVYDDLNRPTEDHRPDGSVWTTTYDAAGQVASRVDGRGKTTSYTYDHQHRLHTKTDPLNRVTTFDYDGVGNLASATLPDGTERALSYDDAGQLTDVDYSGGSSDDVSFAYDDDGQRTSMTDGTGTTSYAYDVFGRLLHQTSGAGQTTTYHYDGYDRVTSIDYPDAGGAATGTVTRTFDDDDDNLTGVTDWLGHTTTFSYDGDDDVTGVTRPNGVDASYVYDDDDAVSSITDDSPATSLTRDDERQLSGTDDGTSPAQSFTYDAGDRVVSGLGRTYAYDDADDLTQTATSAGAPVFQHFDDAGELTSSTAVGGLPVATLGYDDDGQRTSMTPAGGGSASTYDWTSAGRLGSYASGTTTESYAYDGDGLRQAVTTNGHSRHEAWDLSGSTPLIIVDGPTSYVTGPGGLPVEQIAADGSVRYFSHDQHGSTTALTDASGTTVQRYAYDAYGQLTSPAPTVENPFQYAGQFTDATTGLQYLRARYYEPGTGQFLSRDPLEGDTLQPYAYAGDDPINAADPSGLNFLDDVSGVVSSVVPSSVSDDAAGIVDVITGDAASNIACNGLTWKNATEAGANLAMTFVPGGAEERLGVAAAKSEGGALSRFAAHLADDSGHFSPFAGRGGSRLTNGQASDLADWLGFRPTGQTLRGEKVFTDGKRFIVQDATSHSGGTWKMARSPEALNSRASRSGTYDERLNYIGP